MGRVQGAGGRTDGFDPHAVQVAPPVARGDRGGDGGGRGVPSRAGQGITRRAHRRDGRYGAREGTDPRRPRVHRRRRERLSHPLG